MNQNIDQAITGLLQLGADGQGVTINLTIQHVEHLTLALPELIDNATAVESSGEIKPMARKRREPKPRDLGVWGDVKDPDHVMRAARFIVARELGETDHLKIPKDLAYEAHRQHEDLTIAAAKANHKLRQKRLKGTDISRASYWDAAFAYAVLDGLATLEQAVDFTNEWSRGAWTLDDVGATRHDLESTTRAFNSALGIYLRRFSGQFA